MSGEKGTHLARGLNNQAANEPVITRQYGTRYWYATSVRMSCPPGECWYSGERVVVYEESIFSPPGRAVNLVFWAKQLKQALRNSMVTTSARR